MSDGQVPKLYNLCLRTLKNNIDCNLFCIFCNLNGQTTNFLELKNKIFLFVLKNFYIFV